MGKHDSNIAWAQENLARIEKEFEKAAITVSDASPVVKESVLGFHQRALSEAKEMLATFQLANEN